MAIAFIRNSGQVATTSPLGGGSVSIPITAGAIGNNLVVAVATAAATGAASCSDSSGTTYTLDAEITSGVAITVMIFSAKITTSGVTSISVNGFGASLVVEAAAYEFSGLKSSAWFDTKGSGSGIGTATSAGPTAGNLLEGDAWIAAFGSTASIGTFTAGGSATGLTGANQTGGSLGAEYLLTPTAGSTATGTGTFSTTGTWAGLIVAYKAAPVAATVSLSAAGGSSGGAFAATAPTKIGLNGGVGTSEGSISTTAPTRIAQSSAAGSSAGSLSTSAPIQIGFRLAAGQSEAGAPGIEPSEELEPSESLFPGQEDLPLTAPTYVQIIAGASSSTGSMGITAPANLSLSAEGVSSASFADTAPTLISLNAGAASSSGSLSTTAPAQVSLNLSSSTSSATIGFTAATFLSLSAEGSSAANLTATTTAPLILSVGEGVSAGTIFLDAHLDLFPAVGSSTGSLGLRAPDIFILNSNGVSSATISYTSPTIIPLGRASSSSTSVMGLVPFIAADADISISLLYSAESTVVIAYDAEAIVSLV